MLVTKGIKHHKERHFLQNREIFQQLISGDFGFGSFFSDFCKRGSTCPGAGLQAPCQRRENLCLPVSGFA